MTVGKRYIIIESNAFSKYLYSFRPYNVLTLKGTFSLAEMHSWISKCFPEVPEKTQIADKNVLIFKSAFTDTNVLCSYW